MRDIILRGKAFFPGLMAVLVSPTPIKVLAVFDTHKSMMNQFYEASNQVLKLGQGFRVLASHRIIQTPIGSELFFRAVPSPESAHVISGLEFHDMWIEEAHRNADPVASLLAPRIRL